MDFSHPDRKSDAEFQEILDTFVGDQKTVLTGSLPDCKWHPGILTMFVSLMALQYLLGMRRITICGSWRKQTSWALRSFASSTLTLSLVQLTCLDF